MFLDGVGRPREAIEYLQRAGRAEPLNVIPAQNVALMHELMGDFDTALQDIEQARQLKIGNLAILDALILVLAMTMDDRALIDASLEKTIEADKTYLPPANRSLNLTMRDLLDSPQAALETLRRFLEDPAYNNPSSRYRIMSIWASYLGDDELALKLQYHENKPGVVLVFSLWRPIHKGMRQLKDSRTWCETRGWWITGAPPVTGASSAVPRW